MPALRSARRGGSLRLLRSGEVGGRRLRIAVLAPPWIAVPPPGYGGIEAVVDLPCGALVARGHEVTLFAAPGSRPPARVHALLEEPLIDSENRMLVSDELEMAHAIAQLRAMRDDRPRALAGQRPARYDITVTATGYERVYRRAAATDSRPAALAPGAQPDRKAEQTSASR